MLTTVDNPWNPFTHYNEWNTWDISHGYHTAGMLARICHTSLDLSDADNEQAIESAMQEIVQLNVSGMHKFATRASEEPAA
jgi:hypothetical protein